MPQREIGGSPLRYRTLLENLPGSLVFVVDEHLYVVFAGGSILSKSRWPRPALVGRALPELMPPEAFAAAQPHLHATLHGEERAYELTYPTGETFDVLTTPLPSDDGSIPQILIVAQETTAHKQAEEALRRSEAALKRSQAIAHVGHWTWNTQTNTVAWSDEMKRIFGLDPATFAGNLDDVIDRAIHPDDAARVRALNAAVLDAQQPTPAEYRVVWPDGSVHHVLATPGDRVVDAAGRILQLGGIVQDITERKQAEALQLQLERQERLAAVGQLAAGIAHDFNNLLSVISIYAEVLGASPGLTDLERARARTIIDQTQRANRMIRQILDFSRQSTLERQPLDLLPLLKEQDKLLRQTLPEHIELVFDYRNAEYFVLADPTRIQQLVMNLAINGRDAMPEGGQLALALARYQVAAALAAPAAPPAPDEAPPPGDWVRLDVSDTGIGMPPAILAHIFEPFFTTKEPGKGTGLGLAQAYGIVAQHQGHITVASEPGVGTIFSVFLPALPATTPLPPLAAVDLAELHGRGARILVVEDNAVLLASLVELLAQWGYQAIPTGNGEEALSYLARGHDLVDVILSDVVMPRLGGIGLLKALRRRGVTIPLVLMSGHPRGETRIGLEEAGVVAWLDKPPTSQDLARALRRALTNPA
jgi:PAS domain S-box-containing protein